MKTPPRIVPKQPQRPASPARRAGGGVAAAAPAAPTEKEIKSQDAKADDKPENHDQRKNSGARESTRGEIVAGGHGPVADLLREAYLAMSKADHDYDGHRLHAMRDTSEAAKILGETLAGDGHDREAQTTSDGAIRAADGFLERARALAAANHRPRVVEHIDAARRQIAVALSVR